MFDLPRTGYHKCAAMPELEFAEKQGRGWHIHRADMPHGKHRVNIKSDVCPYCNRQLLDHETLYSKLDYYEELEKNGWIKAVELLQNLHVGKQIFVINGDEVDEMLVECVGVVARDYKKGMCQIPLNCFDKTAFLSEGKARYIAALEMMGGAADAADMS